MNTKNVTITHYTLIEEDINLTTIGARETVDQSYTIALRTCVNMLLHVLTRKGTVMITRNTIGIDAARAGELSYSLNTLLANYALFYQNVRGFHWNIRGEKFFELHLKFEELYGELQQKIDEIAERILTLGGTPHHTFTGFTEHATIHAVANVSDGRLAVMNIIDSLKVVLDIQRSVLVLSTDALDVGTNSLMSDYIRAQEKLVWMYSAYLG